MNKVTGFLENANGVCKTLYRQFDLEELTDAYDYSAGISQHEIDEMLGEYVAKSNSVRERVPAKFDVSYGQKNSEKLDIYLTDRPSAPIQVFIHGGGWQAGAKEKRAFPARSFTKAGAIFISMNYTLYPTGSIEQMIEEARTAITWIFANASTFGGDADRIFVGGTSAGGHLAAMVAATQWSQRRLPSDIIKGISPTSGAYDLEPWVYTRFSKAGLSSDLVKQSDPVFYRSLSPLYCDLPSQRCDVIVAVGADEPTEFVRQSIEYYDMLRKNGVSSKLWIAPGRNHYSVLREWDRDGGELLLAIFEQIGL